MHSSGENSRKRKDDSDKRGEYRKFDQISRPWFNERLSDESKMEELANSIDSMLKPTFIVAELKIKRQELDLFKKEKIVNADNIGSKGWLKLNFFEYIWLKLVLKLREYNISITAIQKLKQELQLSKKIILN